MMIKGTIFPEDQPEPETEDNEFIGLEEGQDKEENETSDRLIYDSENGINEQFDRGRF